MTLLPGYHCFLIYHFTNTRFCFFKTVFNLQLFYSYYKFRINHTLFQRGPCKYLYQQDYLRLLLKFFFWVISSIELIRDIEIFAAIFLVIFRWVGKFINWLMCLSEASNFCFLFPVCSPRKTPANPCFLDHYAPQNKTCKCCAHKQGSKGYEVNLGSLSILRYFQ